MWNQEAADELIPDYMQGGLRRYIEQGIPPGHFLSSVLSNDLRGVCDHADSTNESKIMNYVKFLYNYAPSSCWGSKEKFLQWIKSHEEK